VIGDDLLGNPLLQNALILENKIIIKHFPDIPFSEECIEAIHDISRERFWFRKRFQYHKLYLFHPWFKQWNYIFYIDCGIKIYSDIQPILDERKPNRLVAHSDAYPTYERKLAINFSSENTDLFQRLASTYKLDIDYFQTTIMLYDTAIIHEEIVPRLIRLTEDYPISITNDQGIIALYFTCVEPVFQQIRIRTDELYLYDYFPRSFGDKYIMTKL